MGPTGCGRREPSTQVPSIVGHAIFSGIDASTAAAWNTVNSGPPCDITTSLFVFRLTTNAMCRSCRAFPALEFALGPYHTRPGTGSASVPIAAMVSRRYFAGPASVLNRPTSRSLRGGMANVTQYNPGTDATTPTKAWQPNHDIPLRSNMPPRRPYSTLCGEFAEWVTCSEKDQ